jgi:peptide/nickel transport system ATP-binding protein
LNPVLKVTDLETTFFLKSGPFHAVNRVSYEINEGQTLGIVGESGCGKSVTSLSLMRLVSSPGKITHGSAVLNGKNLVTATFAEMEKIRGGQMAMIFQEPMTALNPVLTIGFQLDEQIKKHLKYSDRDSKDRAIEMLNLVGIPSATERYSSYSHQLSGGMRQRAMIAMALSCNPKLLIADEPTTALDVTIQAQILELFQGLQEKLKMSVQFITHDLGVISEVSDNILVMYGGQMCETGNTQDVLTSPRHPYTAALIESRPKLGSRISRLKTIEGSVPAPHEIPAGCPFSTRCSRVKSECWTEKPKMQSILTSDNSQQTHAVACFNPL